MGLTSMPVSQCDICAHVPLVRTSSHGHAQLQGGLGYVVQTSSGKAQRARILVNCSESAPWVKGKECVGLLIYRATLNDSCPRHPAGKKM